MQIKAFPRKKDGSTKYDFIRWSYSADAKRALPETLGSITIPAGAGGAAVELPADLAAKLTSEERVEANEWAAAMRKGLEAQRLRSSLGIVAIYLDTATEACTVGAVDAERAAELAPKVAALAKALAKVAKTAAPKVGDAPAAAPVETPAVEVQAEPEAPAETAVGRRA